MATTVLQRALEAVKTEIIGTPLQQGGPDRTGHGLEQPWQIAQEELVLKVACPSRNDHLLAGQQRGHQVRERLACPGACLGDQTPTLSHGCGDRLRHFELLRAMRKPVESACEQTVGTQDITQVHQHCPDDCRDSAGIIVPDPVLPPVDAIPDQLPDDLETRHRHGATLGPTTA
jgi:hypothetical protein